MNSTQLRFRLRTNGNTTTLISPTNTLSTGVWTHVTAWYDGANMKLYKDGVEVASTSKSGILDTNGTVDAAIGNQPSTASGGERPFDGLIDDVRIYSRALTATEILAVRDAGTSLNEPPTLNLSHPEGLVGSGNFITRANASSQISALASDPEDGDLVSEVTWLSTRVGETDPANLPDGQHTLVATVRDTQGSADSQLLEINVVPGFEGWLGDLGVNASFSEDINSNELSLLEEYGFGINPLDPEQSNLNTYFFNRESNLFHFRFPLNPLAIDLKYHLQTGNSFMDFQTISSWSPLGDTVEGLMTIQSKGDFGSMITNLRAQEK